jgi:hypothetical protein
VHYSSALFLLFVVHRQARAPAPIGIDAGLFV